MESDIAELQRGHHSALRPRFVAIRKIGVAPGTAANSHAGMTALCAGGVGCSMTMDELKGALADILALELRAEINWKRVEALSQRTYVQLTTEADTPQDFPREDVIGYLAGFARRCHDREFGERQRKWLRDYLRVEDPA